MKDYRSLNTISKNDNLESKLTLDNVKNSFSSKRIMYHNSKDLLHGRKRGRWKEKRGKLFMACDIMSCGVLAQANKNKVYLKLNRRKV